MMRQVFCLLGLALIAACSTQPLVVPVEIQIPDALAQKCADQPPAFSDQEASQLAQTMPNAEDREREHWIPRDQKHRDYELCESDRADRLLAIIGQNNQLAHRR